jgi:uncharacterized protein YjiS (DUF1127 family)
MYCIKNIRWVDHIRKPTLMPAPRRTRVRTDDLEESLQMKSERGYAIVRAWSVPGNGFASLLRQAWRQLRRWQQLAAERRQLASLSDAALKDLGISRADVYQEAERPFWDDPLRR